VPTTSGVPSAETAAVDLTPDSCSVSSFTQPRKVAWSINDPPRGTFDFAYNEGHFALAMADEGGWGSLIEVKIMDLEGNRVGGYTSTNDRMEYDPAIVGAPWGGFFVAYKFDDTEAVVDLRIVGRTMDNYGAWKDKGFVASSSAADSPIRLRRLDDRVGLWFKELSNDGTKEKSKYLEVVEGKKKPMPVPDLQSPPIVNETWLSKLRDTDGWPLAKSEGVRVVWADDRFGIIAPKGADEDEQVQFIFLTALCE
jgi:hypothetical protein